jgi:hypothetical protein
MKITEQRLRQLIRGLLVEGAVTDEQIKKAVPIGELRIVVKILKAKKYKKDIEVKRKLYKLANKHIKNIKNLDNTLAGKKDVRGKSKEIAALIYWGNKWSRSAEKIQANIIKKIREKYNVTASTASTAPKATKATKATKSTKSTKSTKATKATPTNLGELATLEVPNALKQQLSKYSTLTDAVEGFKSINNSIMNQWNLDDHNAVFENITNKQAELVFREELFSKEILIFLANTLENVEFPNNNKYTGKICDQVICNDIRNMEAGGHQKTIAELIDSYGQSDAEYNWERLLEFLSNHIFMQLNYSEKKYVHIFINNLLGMSKYRK